MKRIFLTLGVLLLAVSFTRAQAPGGSSRHFETQSSPITSTLIEPEQQEPKRELPDAPIPILPNRQDGPMPCPAGVGKPCALLGGRLYFSDPSHMTEHDKTWFDALKNPLMLGGIAVNVGASIWDYKATRSCIANHTCTEGNPLMGKSRAQQLTVGVSLDAVFYYLAVRLKQRGAGNYAFFCLAANTTAHLYFASHAQALAK